MLLWPSALPPCQNQLKWLAIIYTLSLSALLFDSVALVSLFAMWLLRDNTVGQYISPVVSICVAIYLMFGYVKRTRQALIELTDKTLPEKEQMKILSILTQHYSSYTHEYLNEPLVNCFACMKLNTIEDAYELMHERSKDNEYTFAVVLKENNKVIGEIDAHPESMSPEQNSILDTFSPCWMLNKKKLCV